MRASRTVELAYASLALFALTQGPVFRVWSQSTSQLELFPNPSMQHTYFATFVAVQLPAVLLWSRRANIDWLRERANQLLVALLGWLGLSVVWSTFARQSLPEFVTLCLTTVFGLYLAASFSRSEFWWIVAGAMALGVGVSWFSIVRLWDGAVNLQDDYWIGIYGNRNSLAPVAAVALLASIVVVSLARERSVPNWSRIVTLAVPAALVVFAAIEMWRSGSQNSPVALAAAIVACVAWLVVRAAASRFGALGAFRHNAAPISLALLAGFAVVALRQIGDATTLSGETATFNSRRALWSVNWSGFLEKPWLGWGWMAARFNPAFFKQGTWWAALETQWSHNGYHDLLLGGGVPAAVLFALYLWFASREFDRVGVAVALPRMALAVFVLAAATQESFFVGSHFLWALLVASLAVARDDVASVDEQNPGHRAT
jgi:O-antigen ligase